jgi:hypothetical protein
MQLPTNQGTRSCRARLHHAGASINDVSVDAHPARHRGTCFNSPPLRLLLPQPVGRSPSPSCCRPRLMSPPLPSLGPSSHVARPSCRHHLQEPVVLLPFPTTAIAPRCRVIATSPGGRCSMSMAWPRAALGCQGPAHEHSPHRGEPKTEPLASLVLSRTTSPSPRRNCAVHGHHMPAPRCRAHIATGPNAQSNTPGTSALMHSTRTSHGTRTPTQARSTSDLPPATRDPA